MPRITNTIATDANGNKKTLNRAPAYYRNHSSDYENLSINELVSKNTISSRSQGVDPSNIIKDVVCSAGVTISVQHRLNRKYKGFNIHRPRGSHPISLIEVPQNNEELDSRQITLDPFTDCIVDVEIY